MKKVYFFIAVILVAGILAGCSNPAAGSEGGTGATLRYRTVPYKGAGTAKAAESDDNYSLIYSACDTDNDLYYYVYLLGNIDRVPVAYRQAVIYDGVTPVTIGYSRADTNEYTITEGVEKATQYSLTNNETHGWKVGTEFGVKGEVFSAKLSAEVSGQYSKEEMNGRSVSNTCETSISQGTSTTDTIEVTVGDNNEPSGKYRYSLFCTTDVYYVLVTDNAKTAVEDNYIAVCARPESYAWGIDYEPDLGGGFGKTAPGELFQLPDWEFSGLPDPEDEFDESIIPHLPLVATPSATLTSGVYVGTQYVKLSCITEGAAIYYTLNGGNPTTSSTQYFNAQDITISENTVLMAIAVKTGMDDSQIMTEQYTITAAVNYVKDIYFGSNSSQANALASLRAQTSENLIVMEKDLNSKAKGNYIYMGYTTTTNAAEAIRGLVCSTIGNSWTAYNGLHYDLISDDLNAGAGGSYIYLNQTKESGAGDP
ncbi:MAG: chitobiase/beta-hexosaminidase C-terminal domain-containing protein, partial [Treponema sp.]|nr:chitobiase/beta-hexosaminidase C-terminal domain-containing protein [Treponema sp.]